MNYDSLIDALSCPLIVNGTNNGYTKRHFFDNPKYLPCCHRTACNKCITKFLSARRSSSSSNDYIFNCPLCKISSKITIAAGDECLLDSDNLAKIELEKNLIEINHYLIKKLEINMKNIEDRFASKENYLSKRKAYIEHEIHVQVEQLKGQLDQLEREMKESLEVSTKNMKVNLEKFEKIHRGELDEMKASIENLKLNSLSYINGDSKNKSNPKFNQALHYQTVDSCVYHLHELNKLSHDFSEMVGELTFDPNVDPPTKSLIGNLKHINDLNLLEQFKTIKSQVQITKIRSIPFSNQQMPISPRYLCIADPFSLFFTDSQTKQLIELKLDTGDYVRSTNLNGQLKNPDGICVNPKKGHIYVGDSELKCIFKLDYDFNLIKKFGNKDLKWPKGLFFDYESKFFSDNNNPDRLYVCDYSNQRVVIYNEHDQLRDYLSISITEDPMPTFNKNNHAESYFSNGDHRQVMSSDEDFKFCPLNVKVTKSLIFVTDDWTGGNCIRVFDKLTHRLLRNVGDLNAWNPLGLIIDDTGNLFTTARLYYETGQTNLFCFNRDGELVYKNNLNINSECITDVVVDKYTDKSNHKIICSGDKKIHMIQF